MDATLTTQDIDQLQRLRASILAFQRSIAALPADQQSNPHNEQFNNLRLRVKALLNEPEFDKKVAPAVTEEMLADRFPSVVLPRVSMVVLLGVMLALTGLGVNSVILEYPLVNGIACCVSSGGMLLVMGSFVVLGMGSSRRRLTNLGDLYQRCSSLLYAVDHTLTMAIPGFDAHPAEDIPNIASVVDLTLDSLEAQKMDWQQKLRSLESQRLSMGDNVPMDLNLTLDYIKRELNRVRYEIDRLNGRLDAAASPDDPSDYSAADTFATDRQRLHSLGGPMGGSESPSPLGALPSGARPLTHPPVNPVPSKPEEPADSFDMFSPPRPREEATPPPFAPTPSSFEPASPAFEPQPFPPQNQPDEPFNPIAAEESPPSARREIPPDIDSAEPATNVPDTTPTAPIEENMNVPQALADVETEHRDESSSPAQKVDAGIMGTMLDMEAEERTPPPSPDHDTDSDAADDTKPPSA